MTQETAVKQKQPSGLYLLFATEMWERFSYYSLRGLFVLYLTKALAFDVPRATSLYGTFTSLIYLSPLLGGYMADRWLGKRSSIIIGGILIAAGQFVMGTGGIGAVYVAMGLIILGNGFFKPNISSILGEIYEKNDVRRDGGFTIFYMGINLGSFLANLIAGTIGEKVGWVYGFWTAGFGMILGLIIFIWGKDKFLQGKGHAPKHYAKIEKEAGKEEEKKPLTKQEIQRIAVIFIMAFFSIFFFVLFEQKGAALNLLAEHSVNRTIFGWTMPTTWFQSFNPLFIILFAPVFSKMWIGLSTKGKEPSVTGKFSIAFWLIAIGYAVLLMAAMRLGPGMKMGMMWLVAAYFFFTMGELCLSPVGLSLVTKLSPPKFVSIMMGIWFLANSAANKIAGFYSGFIASWPLDKFFTWLMIIPIIASVILLLLSKKINAWMHGVK
ncbi:Dipeptide/tripeptide permease [Elusimicrobium minutum Pei191]|uniref:Dipeptide/tripeptide permease n=1 Tax=Elusimicrobium minutum (strain Pei191) TaxID=445932 RepID=B2KD77_ELUMP|nr:peptide MFS transporter [Elusimicrobium minutum]ACC98473.1 Dipeptide/tripeptide permease [Elusimicrobium minutum Pei191]